MKTLGSFEELRADGQVESFEEFETWWHSEFPEEAAWFHSCRRRDQKIGYRAIFLGHRHVLEVDSRKERAFPMTSPQIHRLAGGCGTGHRSDGGNRFLSGTGGAGAAHLASNRNHPAPGSVEVFPQWKEEFFQDFSQQEVEEFLTSAVGYPLENNKRLPSVTANEFYHFCALGYRAMGYTGTEKSEKEQYALHADGRDEGLSKLGGDSPELLHGG